jgi:LPS O-antigen subunit length determinant protein (WzzB/FepE family)
MKKNNSYTNDEIDLSEIIKKLWNEKILILSISLIFMVAGFVYGALQPKIYKTEIILREAPSSLFEAYRPFLNKQPPEQPKQQTKPKLEQLQLQLQQLQLQLQLQLQDISRSFNNDVKLNLLSVDTLVQFVEKTNTINDFKNYLKEKNISARDYFNEKFQSDKKNDISNKYFLTYSQPLLGESFLNDYIIFAQQQSLTMFKKQLTQNIINEINIHEQHLEIAKKIGLNNPILQSMTEGRSVVNEPDALFYKGTKVLTQQITYLNKLLNETKNLTLDYNPILEQASSPELITKSPIIYAAIALLLGLFFSLMIVLIRSLLRDK